MKGFAVEMKESKSSFVLQGKEFSATAKDTVSGESQAGTVVEGEDASCHPGLQVQTCLKGHLGTPLVRFLEHFHF